jgi:hypothetical protein
MDKQDDQIVTLLMKNKKTFFIIGENIDKLKIRSTSEDIFLERVSDCTQRIQDHRPGNYVTEYI